MPTVFFLLVKPDNQYSYIWLPYWGPPLVLVEPPFIKTSSYASVDSIDAFTNCTCTNFDNMQIMSNRKFRSRHLVGKKMQHCTGKRKICHKNRGAGRCLGKIWDQFLWNQLSRDQLSWKFNFSQDQLLFIEMEYTMQLLPSSAQSAWESGRWTYTLQQAQVIELYARPPGCISWCGW